jgi:CHAT domain-containing protein
MKLKNIAVASLIAVLSTVAYPLKINPFKFAYANSLAQSSNASIRDVERILKIIETQHLFQGNVEPKSEADRKLAIKKLQQAEAILKQVGDNSPKHGLSWQICELYIILESQELALEICQTYYNLEKANSLTNDSLDLTKNDINTWSFQSRRISQVYRYHKKHNEAISLIEEVISKTELGKGNQLLFLELGDIYYELENYPKAVKYYEQSIQKKSHVTELDYNYNRLGWALIGEGNLKRAEQELLIAQDLEEKERIRLAEFNGGTDAFYDTDFYKGLQKIKVAQGKYNEALELEQKDKKADIQAKIEVEGNINQKIVYPDINEIKQVAKEQNATIINYSLIKNPLDQELDLYMWVIKPNGNIDFAQVDLTNYSEGQYNQINVTNNIKIFIPLIVAIATIGILFLIYRNQKTQKLILISGGSVAVIMISLLTLQQLKNLNPSDTTASSSNTQNQNTEFSLASLAQRGFVSAKEGDRGLLSEEIEQGRCQNSDQCLTELYQILIKPIEKYLPKNPEEQIIFIPDGELFTIPFTALKSPQGKYLIENHTIRTASSIETLQKIAQQTRNNSPFTEALVVGNPIMPKVRFAGGEELQTLSPLPGTEDEAKAIAKMLNTQPLIGQDANETMVTKIMRNAKIIHLATHGFVAASCPESWTSPMLALTPTGSNEYDNGCLSESNIYELNLNAELVVLSACETGLGEIISDGVLGLSRPFIEAGVPSVVLSLWQVPDTATKDLMIEFYQNLNKNMDKAQALRQAMLTTMKQHPDPVNWAGFTLVGNSSPIQSNESVNNNKLDKSQASVSFDICGETKDWVRPNLNLQIDELQSIPSMAKSNKQMLKDDLETGQAALVWKNPIISFNTYGLSLYMQVWYQSGMWTISKNTFDRCTQGDNVIKIRDGKMAWLFLLQHQVTNLTWENNQYVLQVKPTKTGVQSIQFNRQDTHTYLPLKVIDQNGRELTSSSRGWEDYLTVWY